MSMGDHDNKKSNELVHSEGPKHSEPHEGHDGTSFEGVDARAGLVVGSLAVIGLTLVVVFAMTVGIQKYIQSQHPLGEAASPLAPQRTLPPAPQLQVQPWEDLPQMRAEEEKALNSTGKDAAGRYHIPIGDAIGMTASRLQIAPNAPVGLKTAGGGGRTFSGSVADMPPEYRGPGIQGEIQKHGK